MNATNVSLFSGAVALTSCYAGMAFERVFGARVADAFAKTKLARWLYGPCDDENNGHRCMFSNRHWTYCECACGSGWAYDDAGVPDPRLEQHSG